MKALLFVVVTSFSFSLFAGDSSELGSPLMDRVEKGCAKYAEKKAKEAVENYFNINGWAGGNIGAGSVLAAQEESETYKQFINVQCQNMVMEVLEMKLGYAPWQ